MRIIAGEFKGRIIKMPNSKLVRPTTDKVRESLFNYLSNQIDFDEIKTCDIYAGSGALGFEALSRGAGTVHFIEKNYPVYKNLDANIKMLNVEERCEIFKMEAVRFSKMANHDKYDLILADPPFFKDDIHEVVKNLLEREYLAEGGRIIVERSVQTADSDKAAFNSEPIKKMGDSLIYEFE